jgi:hypothetical protein
LLPTVRITIGLLLFCVKVIFIFQYKHKIKVFLFVINNHSHIIGFGPYNIPSNSIFNFVKSLCGHISYAHTIIYAMYTHLLLSRKFPSFKWLEKLPYKWFKCVTKSWISISYSIGLGNFMRISIWHSIGVYYLLLRYFLLFLKWCI